MVVAFSILHVNKIFKDECWANRQLHMTLLFFMNYSKPKDPFTDTKPGSIRHHQLFLSGLYFDKYFRPPIKHTLGTRFSCAGCSVKPWICSMDPYQTQPDLISYSSYHCLLLITITMHVKSLVFAFSLHQISWQEMWLLISINFCTIW